METAFVRILSTCIETSVVDGDYIMFIQLILFSFYSSVSHNSHKYRAASL
jgi:hypothetical protein